ncbi:transposase [Streptomyces galilaeus]|uniref:transposase n=1 Tax=Streptomyces galilaeus TaxID=33899 RepID=UPI001674986E
MIRRPELLSDREWELLTPLKTRAAAGRPRVEDRQVINGMVYKIRTPISWKTCRNATAHGKRSARFRRYALDGVFTCAHTIPEKTDPQRHRHNRGSRGGRPPGLDRETYRRRNVIERCFNRLKGFRGIATRYEKTATSYAAAVTLASFLLWARSA